MDRAVRPAYREERKREILSCLPPAPEKGELEVQGRHGALKSIRSTRDPRRGGDWNGMRILKNGSPSTETAVTSGKSVPMEISVTWLVGLFFPRGF